MAKWTKICEANYTVLEVQIQRAEVRDKAGSYCSGCPETPPTRTLYQAGVSWRYRIICKQAERKQEQDICECTLIERRIEFTISFCSFSVLHTQTFNCISFSNRKFSLGHGKPSVWLSTGVDEATAKAEWVKKIKISKIRALRNTSSKSLDLDTIFRNVRKLTDQLNLSDNLRKILFPGLVRPQQATGLTQSDIRRLFPSPSATPARPKFEPVRWWLGGDSCGSQTSHFSISILRESRSPSIS